MILSLTNHLKVSADMIDFVLHQSKRTEVVPQIDDCYYHHRACIANVKTLTCLI